MIARISRLRRLSGNYLNLRNINSVRLSSELNVVLFEHRILNLEFLNHSYLLGARSLRSFPLVLHKFDFFEDAFLFS